MAKKEQEQSELGTGELPINILAQYVRDISFENPNAPESLRSGLGQPEMDINIGIDARKIPSKEIEHLYEVVLSLRASAMRGGEPVFMAELQYGVTVELKGIPENNHHPFLHIEIPRIAFPYARQILSSLTIEGGYPPLMLNPIDFQALYMERYKDEIEKARAEAKGAGAEKE